ncbi:MAG: class I SAM-dependent methyltransferase [Candidatus Omnitrophica bacterium]|jgi:SAM-dependent methyltransferase|nr:class I SAM-dependent methyltransferase [Candidatus Omnitrophota bacterium]
MKLVHTSCPLCGSLGDYKVIYDQNFETADINVDTFSARRLPDRVHYRIVKCNKDGLLRADPVLDKTTVEDFYSKSKFNYEKQIKNLTSSYMQALEQVLKRLNQNARILEIGCGNGFLLTELLKRGYKNIFGIEPSKQAVLKADGSLQASIKTSFLTPGIFEKGCFDFIFFFQTFDHVDAPVEFLQTCYDLLVPGGYVLCFNHDAESLSSKLLGEKSPIVDIEHPFLYSKKTIKKIFEARGFVTLKIYSPYNRISLSYFLWLLPLGKRFKEYILKARSGFLNWFLSLNFSLRLGNLCIIAIKPAEEG